MMEFIEKTLEMRAVNRKEIIDYFISMDGEDAGHGRIRGRDWEVEVSPESSVALGSVKMPSVSVVLRCRKDLFEQMYLDFRMKFFRAGS